VKDILRNQTTNVYFVQNVNKLAKDASTREP